MFDFWFSTAILFAQRLIKNPGSRKAQALLPSLIAAQQQIGFLIARLESATPE